MTEPHLGTATELLSFAEEMAKQLELHIDSKSSLRECNPYEVIEMMSINIEKRIKDIQHLRLDSPDVEELMKQCVHISNESMMIFLSVKLQLQNNDKVKME